MALTGRNEKQIDSKHRISIPKKLRADILQDENAEVVVIQMDNCLQVYPAFSWKNLQQKLMSFSPFDAKVRMLQRLWGSCSDSHTLDNEGRLTLTDEQIAYAGIKDRVYIVGTFTKIEIWSVERWQELMEKVPPVEEISNIFSS